MFPSQINYLFLFGTTPEYNYCPVHRSAQRNRAKGDKEPEYKSIRKGSAGVKNTFDLPAIVDVLNPLYVISNR